jgi:hypothetical protein
MDNESPVIFSYSREQAIADGVLIDCTELAREAGFRYPVVLTRGAWDLCVALSPAAKEAGNDEKGRLWDVLWMASLAAFRAESAESAFQLRCVTEEVRPSLVTLRAVVGPGDTPQPVITIMLPGED